MPKRNAYLAKRDLLAQKRLARQLDIHVQIGADAAAIAANDVFHMGPTRAAAFHAAYCAAYMEIVKLLNEDAPGDDYTFVKLDERLKQIFGDKFEPYTVRYGRK